MPYDIRKQTDGYHVYNQRTGEDKGVSKSRAMAEKHMGALYAHEPKGGYTSPGMATGGGMVLDDTYRPTPGDAYVDGKKIVSPDPK